MSGTYPSGLKPLVSFLERGMVSGGDAEELLQLLRTLFHAQAGSFGQGFGFAPWYRANSLPAGWTETHTRHQHQDPGPQVLDERGLGSCFRIRSDSTPQQAGLDLYEGFRSHGFLDGLMTRMVSPFGAPIYLILYRATGTQPFSDEDAFTMRLLHPLLSRALAARSALAAIEQPAMEDLDVALRRLRGHVFVSFPTGRVLWSADARARVETELGALTGARATRLDEAIVHLVRDSLWGTRTATLHHALHAEVAWVTPRPRETQRALVMFFDAPVPVTPHAHHTTTLLSRRQHEVARMAAAGKSLPAIARMLGVSLETVRSHMRQVYQRVGVSSRVELAGMFGNPGNLP